MNKTCCQSALFSCKLCKNPTQPVLRVINTAALAPNISCYHSSATQPLLLHAINTVTAIGSALPPRHGPLERRTRADSAALVVLQNKTGQPATNMRSDGAAKEGHGVTCRPSSAQCQIGSAPNPSLIASKARQASGNSYGNLQQPFPWFPPIRWQHHARLSTQPHLSHNALRKGRHVLRRSLWAPVPHHVDVVPAEVTDH